MYCGLKRNSCDKIKLGKRHASLPGICQRGKGQRRQVRRGRWPWRRSRVPEEGALYGRWHTPLLRHDPCPAPPWSAEHSWSEDLDLLGVGQEKRGKEKMEKKIDEKDQKERKKKEQNF